MVHKEKEGLTILAIEGEGVPWYYDIMKFLELGIYPDGAEKQERRPIRIRTMLYILCRGQFYRRSYDGIHLYYLKKEEAKRIMEEVHQGICGPHMRMLAKKILRIGYYWNTMETDCVDFVKSFHDYQTHANLNHVPPNKLYSMMLHGLSLCGA